MSVVPSPPRFLRFILGRTTRWEQCLHLLPASRTLLRPGPSTALRVEREGTIVKDHSLQLKWRGAPLKRYTLLVQDKNGGPPAEASRTPTVLGLNRLIVPSR